LIPYKCRKTSGDGLISTSDVINPFEVYNQKRSHSRKLREYKKYKKGSKNLKENKSHYHSHNNAIWGKKSAFTHQG